MNRVFISDCEGPISKNDNAFEVTSHFVPNGDRLFTVLSRYDDVLADVMKRPGYKPGNTLKLILPFRKAYGVTDQNIEEFSVRNLTLISDVKTALQHIQTMAHAFIVSTSYEQYIRKLCQIIRFPYRNTYCTKLNLDKFNLIPEEKTKLRELAKEISSMPLIEIPSEAESIEDFSEEHRETILRLDEIFWTEIDNMKSNQILEDVHPIGGVEKASAIEDASNRVEVDLSKVIYVGDSITDVEAFNLVKENDGLTVSFNGNQYAIRNAEIAVLSETSLVTAVITDFFFKFGKQKTLNLAEEWNREILKKADLD
ncbi:MAG: HAD hydrolase family protein, partial [Thermoproteota archaeon]